MAEQVMTGALALIMSGKEVIGLMKDVQISENFDRNIIKQLGSIMPVEAAVVDWGGTLRCSFFEVNYELSGVPGALRRDVGDANVRSKVALGIQTPNFEDNVVLDDTGVSLLVYKKIKDAGNPFNSKGLIIPDTKPYCIVNRLFLQNENIQISTGTVSGRDQSFVYLDAVVRPV